MKKTITATVFFLGISCIMLFSSCIKDDCHRTYTIHVPVFSSLTALRQQVHSGSATPIVNTGKFFIINNYIFLNEQDKGIHIIDNTDPAHPQNKYFISIPGNADMYVAGSTLYADMYCDLLALDISSLANITVQKFLTKAFPNKASYSKSNNPDSITIVTGYTSHDTTVVCSSPGLLYYDVYAAAQNSNTSSKSNGVAGSMARFAAVNNYMYAVTNFSLNVINISEAANPYLVGTKNIGWNIETIFPYNNKLYIGAGNSMSVYNLDNPADPKQLSWNGHWCSSDPVIADDNYAYVTLHQANGCNQMINQLEVYDLRTASTPSLIKTYPLAGPLGLSKDGNILFVCDGKDGLKVFNASDASSITLLQHIPGIETYDVIANAGIAYVVAKEGLLQFDYSNVNNIHLISKLLK